MGTLLIEAVADLKRSETAWPRQKQVPSDQLAKKFAPEFSWPFKREPSQRKAFENEPKNVAFVRKQKK